MGVPQRCAEAPPARRQFANVVLDPKEATFRVPAVARDPKSENPRFSDSAFHDWSRRAFLMDLPPRQRSEVVGGGIVGLGLYARPDSYDHAYAAAALKRGWSMPGKPLICDLAFARVDGAVCLSRPRHRSTGASDWLGGR